MDVNSADEQQVAEEQPVGISGPRRASILFWAPVAVVATLVTAATAILVVLAVG